ncbi:hypothetical protein H9P43_003488 [Blastocladiella emersonii ATCC 22665]|nr:hypothetical protein H9P43_003488 [Blastocladiella emersonii ATCC 22665]
MEYPINVSLWSSWGRQGTRLALSTPASGTNSDPPLTSVVGGASSFPLTAPSPTKVVPVNASVLAGTAPAASNIYTPTEAMMALRAGTHHLIFEHEMTGGKNKSATGALWCHCVPALTQPGDVPDTSMALFRVDRDMSAGYNVVVPAASRCAVLGITAASIARAAEIKKAKKAKQEPPPVIEVPTVPPGVAMLKLKCEKPAAFYKRQALILHVRGHRIALVEPAAEPYCNKRLYWEVRLLYPNYPTDAEVAASGMAPVEGTHYTLLAKHRDDSACCCCFGCCFGASGKEGRIKAKLDIVASLASTPAPNSGVGGDDPSTLAPEIELAVLALTATMNIGIVKRKLLMITAPIGVLGIVAVVINVINIFLNGSSTRKRY